jgi:alanine racemase
LKIKGRKLSFNQKRILVLNGITEDDVNNYYIWKITWVNDNENTTENLSKYDEKMPIWTITNKNTGVQREVKILNKD